MSNLQLLTHSRLSAARSCPRLHDLRYNQGIRAIREENENLRFGTLIHRGLEAWWRAAAGDRLHEAMQALQADTADPYDLARAEVMMLGYHERWRGEQLETLAVEAEFACPLINPESGRESQTWQIGGKLDAIARDDNGQVWVVEHKTSSEDVSPGSNYHKRLKMDGQVSLYTIGARALGHEPVGTIYDVLSKPAIRPLKATPPEARKYKKDGTLYANQREVDETPDEYRTRLAEAIATEPNRYYARIEVARLDADIDDALRDVWQLGQRMREDQLANRHPRNPGACLMYNRQCEFFEACCGEADLADPTLYSRDNDRHPELVLLGKEVQQ